MASAMLRLLLALSGLAVLLAGCEDPLEANRETVMLESQGGPRPVADPQSIPISASRIDVYWADNSSNETGWEVHRSLQRNGTYALLVQTGPNITSHSDEGLKPNTEYCYRIRSFRTSGRKTTFAAFTIPTCATSLGAPIPPTGTDARPTMFGAVEVRWVDNSANEDGFRIERSGDAASSWTSVGTTAPNGIVLTDRERPSEQQVCYRVTAFNTFGESPPSLVDCTTPPAAVTNLTAAAAEGPAVDLRWTDNSSIEDGYEVRRAPWGHDPVAVATLPANSTTFHDADLSGNTTYLYCVSPTKDLGTGFFFCAIAVVASTSPDAPSTTGVTSSSSSVVEISWADNSTTEEGFRVERSIDAGSRWVTAGTIGIDETRFADPERVSEQEVCYRVIAFNPAGDSPPSNTDCTIPPAGPSDLTAALVDPGTVELTWTDNSASEDGYEVHYFFPFSEETEVIAVLPPGTTVFRAVVRCKGVENFAVRARKDGGFSDFSNSAAVVTSWPCQ